MKWLLLSFYEEYKYILEHFEKSVIINVKNISVLVALQATESAAGRVRRGVSEEAESAYISQVATNLNTLCEGSDGKRVPPEYCNCDNAPGKKTTGPYDLGDVFNLIFELFGCGPGKQAP